MNFIKTGVSLPCEKVDTDCGVEYVYTIPKSFKYMSEVFNTLPDNSFLCKSDCIKLKCNKYHNSIH